MTFTNLANNLANNGASNSAQGVTDSLRQLLGSNLVEVWDAGEASSVGLVSGAVQTWTGRIRGTVMTAPGATARPGYGADSTNFRGMNAVLFDGSNDSLENLVMGTAFYAPPRPGWGFVYRFRDAVGVRGQIMSALDNPVTATCPFVYRQTDGTINGFYSPAPGLATGPNIGTTVHHTDVLISSSTGKTITSTDGAADAVSPGSTALSVSCKNLYFGNDRHSLYGNMALVLAYCVSDTPSTAQRAAILALARATWGF